MDYKEENNIMIDNSNDYDYILMKVNNILLKLDSNYNDSIYDQDKISNILRKLDIITITIAIAITSTFTVSTFKINSILFYFIIFYAKCLILEVLCIHSIQEYYVY